MSIDAARSDQRDLFAFDLLLAEGKRHLVDHPIKLEARIVKFLDARRTQMSPGVPWMLDDNRIRHPVLAQPATQHDRHAARIRQDRDQCDIGKVGAHLRQVERQAGAHDDGIGSGFARLAHQCGVLIHRLHHVDGNRTATAGLFLRETNLAIEGDQVQPVQHGAVAHVLALGHQVGVVMPQVDRGNCAERVFTRHGGNKPVRRYADAHAALDNGQEIAPPQMQRAQTVREYSLHLGAFQPKPRGYPGIG